MAPHGFVERLAELARVGEPFVSVTMVEAVGSTPQDTGSKMLVTTEGLSSGTVGGGKVEHKAIQHAQAMLADTSGQAPVHQLVEWNLQRDVGMTCGGVVKLFFETYNHSDWQVVIFGAGHVASAVTSCLGQINCHTRCIDSRSEWLDKIADRDRLTKIRTDDLPAQVAALPSDAFVLCITMGHGTDRPVLAEIFRQGRTFPYLGVIGSRAKRGVLVRELVADGIPREQAEAFHCPIGLPLGTNEPGEIAISVVAELIQERDRWRGKK
ncbi:xanthine dehydrogenase accessory protein XdhC [Bythopirellula goksoeyrii]|uniref:XdhC and CoxI family protein n=1 Tax=Bythopirellula goksoeyrii TaxID=1400387 RepID=A0A5B9QE91_9BACT|nr:xanthine dehydrogenase accessory protein XdhC [Bythopirellula goksoeyrii]QEG37264.1 XdhC and CoxI family protein [Bythopirellula goksoeyrii]